MDTEETAQVQQATMEGNLDAKRVLRDANVKVAHEYLEQVPDQIASYEDLPLQTLETVRIQFLEILNMVTKLDEEIQVPVCLAKGDIAKEIASAQKNRSKIHEALLKIDAKLKDVKEKQGNVMTFKTGEKSVKPK